MTITRTRWAQIKSVVLVSGGNFLEMYDFMVFGYYAKPIGAAFFPSHDPFASLMAALMSFVPRRVAAGFGLIALTALVMLVARAPADPYYAQSLHAWEQGRFIRFHGAAQWVGWTWPYAAITYLLVRLAAREER